MVKEHNRAYKGNWVAYANLPSKFPNFSKFFLQLVTSDFCEMPQKSSFQREKNTSLNPDVSFNRENG
jgi:hypothetical protein